MTPLPDNTPKYGVTNFHFYSFLSFQALTQKSSRHNVNYQTLGKWLISLNAA